MSSRLRRFVFAITTNRMVHVEWNGGKKAAFTAVPEDLKFPMQPVDNGSEALYQRRLTRSLSTLTSAARSPTDEVLWLLRTMVPGTDPRDHADRDAQAQQVRDAAIVVADDDDETPEATIVSDSSSHRSVGDLIVGVDAQDHVPPPVVLLQEMEEFEVVSLEDDPMDCLHPTHVAMMRYRCVSGTRHRAGVGYYSTGVPEQRPLLSTNAAPD